MESRSQDPLNEQTLPHKLAAILYADVEGYSRLTGADEAGTHRTLSAYLDLFAEIIKAHRGEVKHYAGDAVLADFTTVSDALNCAVEFQKASREKNETVPEAKRVKFRIGLNLGEVIVDRGEVYGNGVNVAARLETLAEPGGICISGAAHDAIGNKLPLAYEYLGEHEVKNIDSPVRAYRVNFTGQPTTVNKVAASPPAKKRSHLSIAVIAALIAVAGAIAIWQFNLKRPTVVAQAADPVLAMPTGPAIAVLPFTNMSGDPKEDYFSDGLTEDIITELARFKDLYVLARNTTFQYKGKAVDVPAVGKKLGVRYMLEGSVRKSGEQIRIAAQLIDVNNGAHLWAEKYDRHLSDIFTIQDEIAGQIVASIGGGDRSVIRRAARAAIERKAPDDMQAYELVLQAGMFENDWSKEGYQLAKTQLEKAIALAPNYARARQAYAYLLLIGWVAGLDPAPAPPKEVKENAIRASQLDPSDHRARRTAAAGYFFDKQLNLFESEAKIAMELGPNDAQVLAELGSMIAYSGQWDRGIKLVSKANALNPATAAGWYHSAMHYDFYRKGEYQKALEMVRQHPLQDIIHTQWKYVAAYAELGNLEKAREHWKKCVAIDANWSTARMRQEFELWNFPQGEFVQRYLDSFAKAGFR